VSVLCECVVLWCVCCGSVLCERVVLWCVSVLCCGVCVLWGCGV
jgi:hypothetical protein